MNIRWTILVAALLLATGCATKTETQQQAATAQWNTARANVLMSLAKDQFESGNFDKARQTVDEAIKLNSKNAHSLVLSARIYIERGQLENALKQLDAAREADPKLAETDYFTGVIYQRWQQPEKALEFYKSAMTKAVKDPAPVLATAETLVQLKRLDDALALLVDKSDQFENSAVLLDARGQLLVQAGRPKEAIEVLRRATMLDTEETGIREHLAMALFSAGEWREAASAIDRLVKLDAYKNRSDLVAALGFCQLQLGNARDARKTFEQATQINPNSARIWLGLAKACLHAGENKRAEISAKKALALDPLLSEGHIVIGFGYLRETQFDYALISFKKASAIDPHDTVALCMIGYVYEQQGDHDQALKYYSQALKLKPNDVLAKELLAGTMEQQ